ncbi:Hypothetical protein POVR2_LOCUS192 [uncultured virus]|nr:Hypothetical protein POVR2_LOCUS192 [uncultured virus]
MDNKSLGNLSHTVLWLQVRSFSQRTHFWKSRVEYRAGRSIEPSLQRDWRTVYNLLELSEVDITSELIDLDYDLVQYANLSGLMNAVLSGQDAIVYSLVKLEGVDPTLNDREVIKMAVSLAEVDIAELLLEAVRQRRPLLELEDTVIEMEEELDRQFQEELTLISRQKSCSIALFILLGCILLAFCIWVMYILKH